MARLTRPRIRKVTIAAGLAAVLSAVSGISATPALAGTNCPGGYHCVFYTDFDSAKHEYFNSDDDFTNDVFDRGGSSGRGSIVNNNVWAASNSSTGGYHSFYYYSPYRFGGVVFCVTPGSQVSAEQLSTNWVAGDGIGQRDEASSLRLQNTGWFPPGCF